MTCCAVVLAAGAGRRFGGPKALARDPDGSSWLVRTVQTLSDAGCAPVLVALGAAPQAAALLPPGAIAVPVPGWAEGVSASLRAALAAAAATQAEAAIVVPVDTPALPASAVRRVASAAAGPGALARATYRGEPGHPVLLGRAHWADVAASVTGDRGAGGYLAARHALEVPCDDLWSGADVDTP